MKHKVLVNQKCQSVVRGHDFFNGKMKRILEQNREVATVADLHHLVDAMCKTLDMTLAFKVLLFFHLVFIVIFIFQIRKDRII